MIIGEFNESNFDNEDSYEYMLKPKSKSTRREKRLVRKDNKSQKGGLSKGRRKHPLIGNFGMFDKNKRKGAVASSDTIKVGVESADMNVDTAPITSNDPEPTPTPSSLPTEPAVPRSATSNPSVPTSAEAAPSDNAEIKLPSSAVNAVVSSDNEKGNRAASEKSATTAVSGANFSTPVAKEDAKKSNIKEAGFSSLLGFAFLGITIIAVGFALFRVDKKSNPQHIQ